MKVSVNSGDKGGLQNSVHKDSGVFVCQIYMLQNIFSYLMVKSESFKFMGYQIPSCTK